ncbi:MAG: hypothetical protein LQ350_003331 [Teloschistes chrysophthalmus]|nr:MAG: hypothetical protein LQ350_003331 [Niorma chrysophthalma]
MTLPLSLTFGVEIELIVCYDIRRYERFLPSGYEVFGEPEGSLRYLGPEDALLNPLVRADIIECLQRKGVPVHGLSHAPKGPDKISCWTVSYDVSIITTNETRTNEWDGARYTGVEIISPALCYSQSSFVQIQEVLDILKQNFTVTTNETCGLHVHVGNHSDGFPLSTVKNLGLFVAAFERQFNSLHPIERIGRFHGMYRPPTRAWGKCTVPETIASEIEKYDDLCELVKKLDRVKPNGIVTRYFAYNFMNLIPSMGSTGSGTIEFRQHAGTVDATTFNYWAFLCCVLVQSSHAVGELGWFDFLADRLYGKAYSILDLIRDLGDESLADYYRTHRTIHAHPRALWQWQWRNPVNTMLAGEA